MSISIAEFRAWLRAFWQRLVNAASTRWHEARPELDDALESFKERIWQAVEGLFDDGVAVAKAAFIPTPRGQLPEAV